MPRIAVIDDEPLICQLVDAYFLGGGITVDCANTAWRGAELLLRGSFDLALIDVLLPDASGFVLAEFAANQNVPVLLMSGHPHAAMRMEALDFACLQKPFSLVELTLAMGREIAASDANIARIRGGMARLNENLEGLADLTAISKSLIARSRELLAKAVAQRSPLTRG